jgi:hypothetical protein
MRPVERFILLLLLSVTLDFAATAVPTPSGVHWDDEEEAVHLRRPARLSPISGEGASGTHASMAVAPTRSRPRRPDRGGPSDRLIPRARADLRSHTTASPGEDH